jgi:DNA-binding GntR family transcriptional regulator
MRASSPPSVLKPIQRNTMQEQVYGRIRQSLIDGQFKPGQVLTIRDLARQLGTSVMPVREALHKLIVEQVLVMTPTRSIRVPVLTAERFAEVCDARMVLEGHMAKLAAQRADEQDIERIEAAHRAFVTAKTAKDPSLLLQLNREFHFALYAAAYHATIMSLIEPLWVRSGPCMLTLFEELGTDQIKRGATNPHRSAVDAVKARRGAEAQQAVIADIRATSERYRSHLEKVRASGTSSALTAAVDS